MQRGEDQRINHTATSRLMVGEHAHPGEVDLALHPGLTVDDGYRAATAHNPLLSSGNGHYAPSGSSNSTVNSVGTGSSSLRGTRRSGQR